MLRKGRLGTAKVIEEAERLRVVYENDIEYENGEVRLTYTEYAKVIVYDVMDLLGIKRFRNLGNDIYSIQPLYAKCGEYKNMAYVDITDAYYTIYRKYFSVQYRRLSYLSAPLEIPELNVSKRVKRSIYGVMRANSLLRYVRRKDELEFIHKRVYSATFNPDLVNLINDTLHVVAYRAVKEFGAVYFNTDGAIVPVSQVGSYLEYLENLGFKARVKFTGHDVEVRGVGAYRFDNLESGTYRRMVRAVDFSNLLSEDIVLWLEKRIRLI
ncbi:MAG: hypothetical protein QW706_09670 [Candidatus Nezhaarchaeales archaeon]